MRLTGLDALRGIAALLVLLGHTSPLAGVEFGNLYLAVDFFFMLSGYVMARTYEARMSVKGGRAAFIRARIRRLWPTMTLGTLLAIPLFRFTPEELLFGLFMLPMVFQLVVYPMNPPAWSIFFEEFANAAHASGVYRLSTKTLLWVCAALLVILAALSAYFGKMNFGALNTDFWFGFPRVMFSYLLGVCLCRSWRDVPPINIPPAVTILAMPLLLLPPIEGWLFDVAFIALACPLLIAGGIRMNGGKLGVFAGAMSFPLYATHIPIRNLYYAYDIPWPIGVVITLWIAGVVVVCGMLWKQLNRPPDNRAVVGDRAPGDAGGQPALALSRVAHQRGVENQRSGPDEPRGIPLS